MRAISCFITTILGMSCTWVGIWLRLAAHDLAWPLEWSYSGPREDTIWAIHERAYQDVSLAILAFGLLLLSIVLSNWVWSSVQSKQEGRP
jgi:hypothetical protein